MADMMNKDIVRCGARQGDEIGQPRNLREAHAMSEKHPRTSSQCAGNQMLARRGHLVLLRRTLAKQFYFISGGCANYRTMYVFCRHRDIVIGGSVQDGNESELANSDDDWVFRKIIENTRNVFDGRPRQCI